MAAFCRNPTRLSISQRTRFLSALSSSSSTSASPFPSFREVKSAIEAESNPDKLAEIFESTSAFPTFSRHRPLFHLSVHKLARSQRLDLIERVLNHALQSSPPQSLLSEGFWIRIAMLYSGAGMVDHAVRTLNQMEHHKCPRTEKSLCALLSVHLDNKLFDKMPELISSNPLVISPGVKSYNLVLKSFCEEKQIESALQLIEKMEEAKIAPDINSYNLLLGAYFKNGDKLGFDGIVKEIGKKGLEPNLATYNYRIHWLCKKKECARAKKLLDEMISKGIKPNSASYNALIFGYCKLGDLDSAKKVLDRMLSDGDVSPPSFTYYTLMNHMVSEGEFDSALEMCKEIVKRKWVPPFEAMRGLVIGLVERSKTEEAKEIVGKMKMKLKGDALDSWGKIEAALPLS